MLTHKLMIGDTLRVTSGPRRGQEGDVSGFAGGQVQLTFSEMRFASPVCEYLDYGSLEFVRFRAPGAMGVEMDRCDQCGGVHDHNRDCPKRPTPTPK